jgi:hypothetical protein
MRVFYAHRAGLQNAAPPGEWFSDRRAWRVVGFRSLSIGRMRVFWASTSRTPAPKGTTARVSDPTDAPSTTIVGTTDLIDAPS